MKQNLGKNDRIIRVLLGIAALVGSFYVTTLVWQIVLWVVAAIMLITSAFGFCGIYALFHISTKK